MASNWRENLLAREPKSGKSETLTIRLDPKTRFVLEYLSRLKGQTITTVVERAIVVSADQETVPDHDLGGQLNWHAFWDVTEGIRAINMATRREFFPTYEEERRVAFCREHWPFFYINASLNKFRVSTMNILWPRIDEFVEIHERTKHGGEYWAAGKAMQAALRAADLKPPDWPILDAPKPTIKSRDLDDEIPF